MTTLLGNTIAYFDADTISKFDITLLCARTQLYDVADPLMTANLAGLSGIWKNSPTVFVSKGKRRSKRD